MATSEVPGAASHRGLLALVIILGVLILLGVVGLIVTMFGAWLVPLV